MRRLLLLSVVVLVALSSPASAQRAEGEAPPGASADREALEGAVTLLKTGEPEPAAARLGPLTASADPAVAKAARYHFAKALYRLGFLHAALAELEAILAEGTESRYFRAALEWCLFIGRKMVDDVAVNEVLVQHAAGRFPERYRDEFAFRLARHHFARALVEASEAETPPPPPPPEAEDDDEGISFDEDLFGAAPGDAPEEDEEGISFGEDLFSAEPESEPEPEGPASPAKGEAPASGMTPAQHREAARRWVLRVSKDARVYPRAKFLEGLLRVQASRENEALAAFKEVVEVTKDGPPDETEAARRRRKKLRELAFFQLARLRFGAKQPSFSIFYYRKIDRDSLEWLDALYEASWAEYRLGRYERALGNLLTVHAPFFEDSYYPESHILKAVIYYENCRYREAGQIISDFLERYEPVFEALEARAAESRAPEGWYALLAELEVPGDGATEKEQLLARVLEIALQDPELLRLRASIDEVSEEIGALEDALGRSPLAGVARLEARLEGLRDARRALERQAGEAIARKLRAEAAAMKRLVAQALRVRVETAKAEEGRLEATLSRRDQRPKTMEKPAALWTDDEKLVWPFEGEYWRDELGTYELTLARSCR
jgi:hypothetical protein